MNGFLCLDKPVGPSSFGALRTVQRTLGIRKMGHAGTLDPAASGLLVMALDEATRLLPYLQTEPKIYEFTIQFGTETDTLDATGTVLRSGGRIPSAQEVESVLPDFLGSITQRPPRFSAAKINGVRAYRRARNNEEFEPEDRTIRIDSLFLRSYELTAGTASCTLTCSTGTYVRSLARDIALRLDTVAHASMIHRTAIGRFSLTDAIPVEMKADEIGPKIISLQNAFAEHTFVNLDNSDIRRVLNGCDISIAGNIPSQSMFVFACNSNGTVVAMLKRVDTKVFHPQCVLPGAASLREGDLP